MIYHWTPLLFFSGAIYRPSNAEPNTGDDDFPIVQTSYGRIRGMRFNSTWTKKEIYSFRGIPYASPPVGDLRFKDPVPPNNWGGVRDCTRDYQECPQNYGLFVALNNISFNTSEDCLFVNVYTPQIIPEKLLPVMVWVHGGGFLEGSGTYYRYGSDFLVSENVVVVTFNYRLGALGFLTLGTTDFPGNSALKDQAMALKWVQKEIYQFGGDAGEVTLFGESAGSSSVHLHYLSPLSKGLFHRVIGESGTALGDWAVRDNGVYYGLQMAEALNCSTADMDSIKECLMAVDAEEIVRTQALVKLTEEDMRNRKILVFIPTIDKNTSTNPFVPDFPSRLIEQKQGSYVPFIMGINTDEGIISLGNEDVIKNITNNLENFIPAEVREHCSKSRLKLLTERIRQFYFHDPATFLAILRGYINLHTDVMFGYPTAISAKSFRERAHVYLYYFSYNGSFKENIVKFIERKFNFTVGVAHAEELSYLFIRQKVNQTAAEDSNEMTTWKRMVRMWTNFAKFGKPTAGMDPELQNITWSPVGNVTTRYLRIDVNLTMVVRDFLGPSVTLWDSMTPSSSHILQATGVIFITTAILYMSK